MHRALQPSRCRSDVERKFRGNVGERWRKEQMEANLKALWAIDQTNNLAALLGNFAANVL